MISQCLIIQGIVFSLCSFFRMLNDSFAKGFLKKGFVKDVDIDG